MELAGADDMDGKPDSGELSGESESNAATIAFSFLLLLFKIR